MNIRLATPADVPAIDALLRASFAAPDEAMLVQRLCIAGDMVLTMIAEDAGEVAGVAVFSRMAVEVAGKPVASVALAPVAVASGWRRQGIGEAMIAGGHDVLARAGYLVSFVLGEPGYYGRFGYERDWAAGFDSRYAGDYFMALPLNDAGMPCGVRGRADHAPAFATLAQEGAA